MTRRVRVALCAIVFVALLLPTPVAAQSELESARARAAEALDQFEDSEEMLYELDLEIELLESDIADTRAAQDQLGASVRELAIRRYTGDRQLTLGSVADASERAVADALAAAVITTDNDVLDDYRTLSEDLADAESVLDQRRAEQTELLTALEDRVERMNAEVAELQRLELIRLEEERKAREAEEARRAEEEAAARRAASAESSASSSSASSSSAATSSASAPSSASTSSSGSTDAPSVVAPSGGGLVCPVPGSTFSDSWGASRSGGRAHKGVDMMAPSGAPVYAPVGGSVSHSSNSLGGKSFHLDGDDGNYYYGTHMSSYGAGGRVAAGTVIGYVGNTGNARYTAPHLHLEVHPNHGGAVNPYPYVRPVC